MWGQASLAQAFRRALARLELPARRLHDLRHYFVTRCFRAGVDAHTVQALAGHHHLSVTARYAHTSSDAKRAAVPRAYMSLSSLDFPKTTLMIGSSLWIGNRWRFDAALRHMFTQDVVTSPSEAKINRISPLEGNASSEPVNGGTCTATAQLTGFGLEYEY